MKVGMRKPNYKKSFKARTTAKYKRRMKKAINPLYGKKGMGMINNPKKAIYNRIYYRTTFKPFAKTSKSKYKSNNTYINKKKNTQNNVKNTSANININDTFHNFSDKIIVYQEQTHYTSPKKWKVYGAIMKFLAIITAFLFGVPGLLLGAIPMLIITIIAVYAIWKLGASWTNRGKELEAEQAKSNIL